MSWIYNWSQCKQFRKHIKGRSLWKLEEEIYLFSETLSPVSLTEKNDDVMLCIV